MRESLRLLLSRQRIEGQPASHAVVADQRERVIQVLGSKIPQPHEIPVHRHLVVGPNLGGHEGRANGSAVVLTAKLLDGQVPLTQELFQPRPRFLVPYQRHPLDTAPTVGRSQPDWRDTVRDGRRWHEAAVAATYRWQRPQSNARFHDRDEPPGIPVRDLVGGRFGRPSDCFEERSLIVGESDLILAESLLRSPRANEGSHAAPRLARAANRAAWPRIAAMIDGCSWMAAVQLAPGRCAGAVVEPCRSKVEV